MQLRGAILLIALVLCAREGYGRKPKNKPKTDKGNQTTTPITPATVTIQKITDAPTERSTLPATADKPSTTGKQENSSIEVDDVPFDVLRPYATAPLAWNHLFAIVVPSTLGGIVFLHALLFVIYFVMLSRPLSRHPTKEEKEYHEDDDDDEEDDAGDNKKGSKAQLKKKNGQSMSRTGLGSKASVGGSKTTVKKGRKKGGSKDFQFDDKTEQDTGTLMQSATGPVAVGQSQETRTDLASATPR